MPPDSGYGRDTGGVAATVLGGTANRVGAIVGTSDVVDDGRVNPPSNTRRLGWLIPLLVGAIIVVPALAEDLSSGTSAGPAASAAVGGKPDRSPKRDKAEKRDKADKAARRDKAEKHNKAPEVDVTITGTVGQATDADGDVAYTLVAGGKTYRLDAGPAWWWGDAHPLRAFVGRSVAIVGQQETGSDEIDVRSVGGTVVRAEGKPPWAGGWKVVGSKHPGWSAEKAAKHAAKQAAKGVPGRGAAPGQLKDRPNDGPQASDAPG